MYLFLRFILLVAFVASATSIPAGLPTKSVDVSNSSTGTSVLHPQATVGPTPIVSSTMGNNGSKTSGTILLVALAAPATSTPTGSLPANGVDIGNSSASTSTVHPQPTVGCSTIVAPSKTNSTILLLVLVASVTPTPTGSVPTHRGDISNSSTDTSAVDIQPTVGSSTVVSSATTVCHNGSDVNSTSDTFVTPQLSGIPPHPTQVLIPQLDNSTTVQQPTPTTPSVPVGFNLFMEGADTPSLRVIVCIVIAIIIFVAANISLYCFWHRCTCRSQPQPEPRPLLPPRRPSRGIPVLRLGIAIPLVRNAVSILMTPTATPTSSQRLSSSSDRTLAPAVIDRHHNELSSSRYSAADGGPNNPRLSSNSDTTVVSTSSSYADNKSAMNNSDSAVDGGLPGLRLSSNPELTVPANEPRPDNASGGDSFVAGVEMVLLPVVVRPPAARHATRHTRPRVPLMEGARSF